MAETCKGCGAQKVPQPSGRLVCKPCSTAYSKAYRERNAERRRQSDRDYYHRNKDAMAAKREAFHAANPEYRSNYYAGHKDRAKELARAHYHDKVKCDPDKIAKKRAATAAWREEHPEKIREYTARREARKRQAIPAWANDFFIEEAYRIAVERTRLTGIPWEVDHIVPLQSELVCGLHWEGNLQVIPAVANLAKSNSWWPDMPNPKGPAPAFFESPSCYLVLPTASSQRPLVSG